MMKIDDLLTWIASTTGLESVLEAIKDPKFDINQFGIYGNNPIILSILKGYEHHDMVRSCKKGAITNQKCIVDALLTRDDLDINAVHRENGMTALHIACLRGDSLDLINELIGKGASLEGSDKDGNQLYDLLFMPYEVVQKRIEQLTTIDDHLSESWQFGYTNPPTCPLTGLPILKIEEHLSRGKPGERPQIYIVGNEEFPEHQCVTATLPKKDQRSSNTFDILESYPVLRPNPSDSLISLEEIKRIHSQKPVTELKEYIRSIKALPSWCRKFKPLSSHGCSKDEKLEAAEALLHAIVRSPCPDNLKLHLHSDALHCGKLNNIFEQHCKHALPRGVIEQYNKKHEELTSETSATAEARKCSIM